MNSHSDMPEVLSPSIRWFFTNPVFLSIELILIYSIINIEFLYPNELLIGSSFLLLFAFIYYFLDFSPVTPIQTFLIILAVLIQIIFSFFSITIPQFLIPMTLIFSVIVSGLIYFFFSKVIIDNGIVNFKSNSVESKNVSIESRIRTIGGIFGFGDIILHYKEKKYVISGINNNIEIRRKMIDDHQLQPHKQTATWSGTLVFFLICTMILFSPIILCLVYFYIYFSSFTIPLRILFSVSLTLFLLILLLNVRLPRIRKDPAFDLINLELINTGMWTKIFLLNDSIVVKQLFRCGWGHNNYNGHKAPIIGEKMCGKWNPLALLIMHNIMLVYQMIGVHRRKIYEHHIEAIPRTYTMPGKYFRYLQEYVPKPLNLQNLPDDIKEQFFSLNEDLKQSGLFIDDIHAGNVRINSEGRIKLVDGELYTDGEILIKNLLVNGIDDRLNGMEKVLGCERIIRWVDHRQSVDDIVNQG